MAMLCICGICIPYSVLWPLLVVALREIWYFFFGRSKAAEMTETEESKQLNKEASDQEWTGGYKGYLTKDMKWKQLIGGSNPLFVKFTAKWCKPCKEIEPLFKELAEKNTDKASFINVDVDEFDELAAEYGAMTIPLFVCLKESRVLEKLSGKNEEKIRSFVENNLVN
jgi:thiol-disulfide isomerase/thioredoxin